MTLSNGLFSGEAVRFGLFTLLTVCGFFIFAFTMTFVPVLPAWINYSGRFALLLILAALWRAARGESRLRAFRPVFFAYFTAVLALSLGFFFGDWALKLFRLTTQTRAGIAVAKFSQACVIVFGVLVMARLCSENLSSLYIRRGRLLLGLSVGFIAAAVCFALSLQQPSTKGLGASQLWAAGPWILLFVVSNGFMEELLFRGLFLGRYKPLIGRWPAIFSTALAFTLAHMQVKYTPDILTFLVVVLGLSIAWGWLIEKTDSLWGSALFHAGADLLIIVPILKTLGAV
jgi:membrane protease YdiL (CAAX protease family)